MTKKQLLMSIAAGCATLVFAASANAAVEGPYIGGALGWGDTHQIDTLRKSGNTINSGRDTGLAGRLFAGIGFTPNLGAEMGYTKFSNSNVNVTRTGTFADTNMSATLKTYAIDLVAKITVPLQDGFNIYGKVGGAYLNQAASATTNNTIGGVVVPNTTVNSSSNTTKILPTFGLGAGFDVNKNVTTDISWMHIQKVGDTNLQNTDLVAVGLTYHFG
jgi:opacity protein-like surface antigen